MRKRVVILSFDSFGDLTLRQPLFTALLEAGDQVTVAVRQGYDRLLPFLDPRLGVVTTEMDPYCPSSANTPGNAEALRLHIARLQPQLLVCALYNRTSLDEWLLGQFPDVERIGLRNPSLALARCDPQSVNPDRFLPPVGAEALFTHSVACGEGDHEAEKNRALFKAIAHQDMDSYVPCLTVPNTLAQSALQLLQGLGLEAGHYVVGCPAGGFNVSIKAWPAESYVAVLDHLYHQYHLPVLLTGIASEAAQLHAIAQATQSQGVRVAVWIGGGEDLGLLLGLLRHSRLYVGADTGPMHFAGALGVPVIAHLGGGHWPRFLPLASRCFVATQQLPCFGCGWQCWFDEAMCMSLTSPDIFKAGLDWILSQAEDERRIETGRRLDPMTVDLLKKGHAAKQASEADRGAQLAAIHQLQAHLETSQTQAAELAAKEAVIQTLRGELAAQNDTLLQAQRGQLADREEISQLQHNESMAQRALETLRQALEAKESILQAQHCELVAKEAVIQELDAFRRASLRYHWFVQPLQAGLRRLEQCAKNLIRL